MRTRSSPQPPFDLPFDEDGAAPGGPSRRPFRRVVRRTVDDPVPGSVPDTGRGRVRASLRGLGRVPTGVLVAALLLPLLPASSGAQDASDPPEAREGTGSEVRGDDPEAVRLLDRWIGAIGGMERYRELETARYTLTTELYDTATGRLRRARPRYVEIARAPAGELARIERWEGDDFIEQAWDGVDPDAWMNGEPLGPGEMDYDEVTYVASDVHYWIALPYKLRDPGVNLHYDGTDAENRHVVRVTFGDEVGDHQDVWRYFFVDERSWPVEVQYIEEGKESVNRLRFEDIRTVDGYVFVGRRVHFDEEGRVTKVLDTSDFAFNPEIDPEVFRER